MSFNSLEFLIFLPIVVLLYWVLPHRVRWVLLLIASYYFYMSWNAWLIFLIMSTTLVSYVAAILIERTESVKTKRIWLVVTLVICLGCLVFFKYFNFLLDSVIDFLNLFSLNIDSISLNILLPVGISFYTFQTLSYVIDVYRGNYRAEYHLGYYALYVSYFPQLVAGPIESPGVLLPQLRAKHSLSGEDLSMGMKQLISGFFRKCVIADFCGIFVDAVYADLASCTGLAVFLASFLFLLQIYNDFAGYSEIALGAARLMGVKLSVNFDRPLLSVSTTEFYRRWHITLNRWFTQYVYIPLGGNRKGMARKLLNTLIVFSLCGLWHGANWTYVLWGLSAGIMVCIESLIKKPVRKFCSKIHVNLQSHGVRFLRHIVMLLYATINVVLFRSQSIGDIITAYTQIFTSFGFSSVYVAQSFADMGMDTLQLLQVIVSVLVMAMLYKFTREPQKKESLPVSGSLGNTVSVPWIMDVHVYVYAILVIVLCWLALIASSDVSSFAYFQF